MEQSSGCLLFTVVDVMVKQFTPLWPTSSTIPWGIYQDRFPWSLADLVEVESFRVTLWDRLSGIDKGFDGNIALVSCLSGANPYAQ